MDGDTVEITLDTQVEANALLIQAQEHDGEKHLKVSEIHTYHTAGGAPRHRFRIPDSGGLPAGNQHALVRWCYPKKKA